MSHCYRHPVKTARRKCYRCKQVICIDCYYRRDRHIFCSRKCFIRYKVASVRSDAAKLAHRPVPLAVAVAVIVAVLAPLGVMLTWASAELDAPFLDRVIHRTRDAQPVAARITSIEEGETTMVVSGLATPGAVIFLMRDGRSVANGVSDPSGQFRFSIELGSAAATFTVAAAPRESLASMAFKPDRPIVMAELRDSVRSNQARFVESFNRGPADDQSIVLSFDAGSSDKGAQEILDTLRAHGIQTTIFLTGDFVENFPSVARRIVADGHEVGNHTYTHPRLTTFARNRRQITLPSMTRERLQSELSRTAEIFHRVTGAQMAKYWRAPFGEENSEIRGWAAELGYLHVGWTKGRKYNLDSLDWVVDQSSPIYFTPEELAERMLGFDAANNTTLNGGIILMHLGTDRGHDDRIDRALPSMIARFQGRGFRFVKVSAMRGSANAG
ncbi:MAG: polysaccharide deacetylase family protein [Thermoanaerobaculia bacterium]